MTFQTIPGAGQIDFIGTDGVDVLAAFNIEQPSFTGGRKDNDVIGFAQVSNGILRAATAQGGEGADTLTLPNIDGSVFNGNKGDDTIDTGLAGNTITNSLVAGGDGNDTIFPVNGFGALINSTVNGNKGNDTITVAGNVSNSVVLGGQDNDTIAFTAGLIASFSEAKFNGNDGTDTINLGTFGVGTTAATLLNNVTFFGGQGGDTISALGAVNGTGSTGFMLSGDKGNDNITGSAQDDTLMGGEGNDTMVATAGKDLMQGQAGDDSLTGALGNDTLFGGAGNDILAGDGGTNRIVGGEGADTYNSTGVAGTDTFVIEAISNSSATTSGTTQGFDTFGLGVGGVLSFTPGTDKMDLVAVASTLAGGAVTPTTVVGGFTAVGVATAADFGALKTSLDGSAGAIASNTTTIQASVVTVGAGALAGTYLWINDNQAAYNTGDLMFKIDPAIVFTAGDFTLV